MREKLVAGNWKMNKTMPEAVALAEAVAKGIQNQPPACKVLVIPPFVYIDRLSNVIQGAANIGAQNCCSRVTGAYTGEVSATMLASMGVEYCIVGHSERRVLYAEGADVLEAKLQRCYDTSIKPIFCIGENHLERTENRHFEVIQHQLEYTLFNFSAEQVAQTIIAYEPVWAIGTGLTATPEQAQEMHAFIRNLVSQKLGAELADNISILYGGSCNAQNAASLFAMPDIDGGLVGGASLVADDFLKICHELR